MASFAERAESAQLTLPRGWHQYKHENLVSFFAVPGMDVNRVRWITERVNRGPGLTVFWRVDTPKSQVRLEEFRPEVPDLPGDVFEVWDSALQNLQSQLESVRTAADAEVYLPHLAPTAQKDQTLAGWLSVASPDQQSFIAAPTDRSIRLRGPAGSGKTLALTLKAVRETLAARTSGSPLRVLIATHSWSLASQISHNIDMLGVGDLPEIEVFPLLAVAENLAPQAAEGIDDYAVVGDDSFSGKRAQLDEILDVLSDFLATDWVTYKKTTSPELRARFESDDVGDHLALAWDLLTEFGSVIGAAGIFPGAGSESRYIQTPRSSWMLPLVAPGDHRVIFRLYVRYMKNLDERKLITTDQVIADFLNYLASHAWNRARRTHGYDLVFVDEFHLFSPLERQAIHYLTANVLEYPRIFMAMDPRQSPSEVFIGVAADSTQSGGNFPPEEDLGDVTNLELSSVHRFTPQILSLVKHIHHAFPTFALGDDWEVDFANVTSSRSDGKKPLVLNAGTAFAEENDIVRAVHDVYQRGRVAIAVVDGRFWPRYSQLAATLSQSGKFHVATLSARADIDDIGYRSRGIVLGAAEHLAGLQFETVLTVGLPNIHDTAPVHERRRLLSLLYLAVTRAESEVRIFTNDEDGGVPDVLLQAAAQGHAEVARGAEA
ncbi:MULTISPECIES: hypothetical protein [Microbacterium]|uniref:hypothetical protein n=1 Tax=Microbacterium TaxID=33882 RepID=UPI00128FAF37|nr:hypothetical protein [Microbacterium testaceum]